MLGLTGAKGNMGLHRVWQEAEGVPGINGSFSTNRQIIRVKEKGHFLWEQDQKQLETHWNLGCQTELTLDCRLSAIWPIRLTNGFHNAHSESGYSE